MISIATKDIQFYNGMLLIPIPPKTSLETIEKAKAQGKTLRVRIDNQPKLRSQSANSYMWVLCQEIAVAMSKDGIITKKEDVYRQAIQDLFIPVSMPVPNSDIAYMKSEWERKGIGWICNIAGESTLYNHTRLEFYKGSSQFDTTQMSRLIEGLIQDAEALGLQVYDRATTSLLLENWERDRKRGENSE